MIQLGNNERRGPSGLAGHYFLVCIILVRYYKSKLHESHYTKDKSASFYLKKASFFGRLLLRFCAYSGEQTL